MKKIHFIRMSGVFDQHYSALHFISDVKNDSEVLSGKTLNVAVALRDLVRSREICLCAVLTGA